MNSIDFVAARKVIGFIPKWACPVDFIAANIFLDLCLTELAKLSTSYLVISIGRDSLTRWIFVKD